MENAKPRTERVELLVEVADALQAPAFDCELHHQHVVLIDTFLNEHPTDPAADELRRARDVLHARLGVNPMNYLVNVENGRDEIVEGIRVALGSWPIYVYHGTASKRLASISTMGLLPAFAKTLWSSRVNAAHLASGVFFTTNWRAASDWARLVSHTLKGDPRKDTQGAIVRIRADGLNLTTDVRAMQPDCFIVADRVETSSADVLVGGLKGVPSWQPLSEWIAGPSHRELSGSRPARSRNAS